LYVITQISTKPFGLKISEKDSKRIAYQAKTIYHTIGILYYLFVTYKR
jgi:hypothetical protein